MSLTSDFVESIERKILTGKYQVGDKLPPLRDLALDYHVSRSVINAGIVELTNKGYLHSVPRKYTEIIDYKRYGTLAIISGIINNKLYDKDFMNDIFETRMLIETRCAALASLNHSDEDLTILNKLVQEENKDMTIEALVTYDLRFHHAVANASKNSVYSLILNSFAQMNSELVYQFYEDNTDINFVYSHHQRIFEAIKNKDAKQAGVLMSELLFHGEQVIKKNI